MNVGSVMPLTWRQPVKPGLRTGLRLAGAQPPPYWGGESIDEVCDEGGKETADARG